MLVAEMSGVYEILKHVWLVSFRRVVVKTDNLDVFQILEGKSSALSGNTIVESTKSLLQLNWEVRLQRIGNVQNRVAYALAVASLLTSGNSRHHQCM
ncbi:hypothetical protein V6N11_054824 [Hibiscus sabdariffa]|uniref:RNase H type-1 domain-containing protein n=1 Tax=Hibiscus sabdariffa TaxID=183260 RepID=A0ABR2NB74_9ROSI